MVVAKLGAGAGAVATRRSVMGCLLDVVVAIVTFVVVGLAAGEAHSGHGQASVQLSTVPTLIWLLVMIVYVFALRLPARRRRRSTGSDPTSRRSERPPSRTFRSGGWS
jgi:hypothetical protein